MSNRFFDSALRRVLYFIVQEVGWMTITGCEKHFLPRKASPLRGATVAACIGVRGRSLGTAGSSDELVQYSLNVSTPASSSAKSSSTGSRDLYPRGGGGLNGRAVQVLHDSDG